MTTLKQSQNNPAANCPKWENCSANHCPLNSGGKHIEGEPTCFFMREAMKGTPRDLFCPNTELKFYEAANDHICDWDLLPSSLKKDLNRSTRYPSRRGKTK